MAYEITFDQERNAHYKWSDDELQSISWKKGKEIIDKIIIKPSGRCNYLHDKKFNNNIIYKLHDYLLAPEKRRSAVELVVLWNKDDKFGKPGDVAIHPLKAIHCYIRDEMMETYKAIVSADIQYSKPGGGVLYKHPLYTNETLLGELMNVLESLKK